MRRARRIRCRAIATVAPATDDWPFLYMRTPGLPRHYLVALALVLAVSAIAVLARASRRRASPARWSWHFFFLGAGFMLLETKSIVQFALLWGSTWSSASLAIASVLVMALASALVVSRIHDPQRGLIAAALLALIAAQLRDPRRPDLLRQPRGRIRCSTRVLVFSPVFCAGLLFSSSFKRIVIDGHRLRRQSARARWSAESASISRCSGYRFLLVLVAVCYLLLLRANALRIAADRPGLLIVD